MTVMVRQADDLTTHWIGGELVEASEESSIVIHDPADGSVLAHVPRGSAQKADAALRAARSAHGGWADRAPADRRALLREGAAQLKNRVDAVAELLVRENGKPLAAARAEVELAIDWIAELVELGVHLAGRSVPAGRTELTFQHVTPRGVAVCLNTWNAPVMAAIEMVVANLIVGNTVVLKSSERAPLAVRAALEHSFAHLPAGTLNVLSGDGANMGAPLVAHREMDVVCFIGSVGVGRKIGEAAGRQIRKAVLELGGKDALIVDETVDADAAAAFAGPCCFANSGQICTSTERIYVVREAHDAFVEALRRVAEAIHVGPGLDPQTQMGPLIDEAILANVQQQVDDAVRRGARIVTGGRRLERAGCFFPPTVLAGVHDDSLLMHEETFGPLAPVVRVDSFDEAITRANRSSFGLSAIVLTDSSSRALRAIHGLRCGMVRINAPRGQATACCAEPARDSGLGFGHGAEFLRELTYCKSVRWREALART